MASRDGNLLQGLGCYNKGINKTRSHNLDLSHARRNESVYKDMLQVPHRPPGASSPCVDAVVMVTARNIAAALRVGNQAKEWPV
jgi:hypothetical protein